MHTQSRRCRRRREPQVGVNGNKGRYLRFEIRAGRKDRYVNGEVRQGVGVVTRREPLRDGGLGRGRVKVILYLVTGL